MKNLNGIATLDTRIIEALLGVAPPASNWLSSTMFPAENAFHIRGDGEEYLVAHPEFWESVPAQARALGIASAANIQIVMIDDLPADTEAMRGAKWSVRRRYARALCEHIKRQGALE